MQQSQQRTTLSFIKKKNCCYLSFVDVALRLPFAQSSKSNNNNRTCYPTTHIVLLPLKRFFSLSVSCLASTSCKLLVVNSVYTYVQSNLCYVELKPSHLRVVLGEMGQKPEFFHTELYCVRFLSAFSPPL